MLERQNYSDHVFQFAWDIPGLCLAQLLIVPLLLSSVPVWRISYMATLLTVRGTLTNKMDLT